MMISSKYTRLRVQGASIINQVKLPGAIILSIRKELISTGIVFDELTVRSVLSLSYSPGNKTYHIVMVLPIKGWFQLFIPAHKSLHSHQESFHSHQWVAGMQFYALTTQSLAKR